MNDNTHNALRGALFAALILVSAFAVASAATAAVTSADRSVSDSTTPGGDVTVTVTTTVDDGSNGVALAESFSGPVAGGQLEGVTIDGQQADINDLLTTAVDSNGAAITISDSAVSAGDQIVFEYTVTAASDAAGDDIEISGSVTSGDEDTLTDDTVPVQDDTTVGFQVDNIQPASATITRGDSLTVSADITNTGSVQESQSVSLNIGSVTLTQTVTLNGGQSTIVEFTNVDTGVLNPGTYNHQIATEDDSVSGTLTVEERQQTGVPQPGPEPPALDDPDNVDNTNIEDVTATGGQFGGVGTSQVSSTSINGLTILNDYPQHGTSIFDPIPGSVFAEDPSLAPRFSDIDPRFTPVAVGQHVGLVGLPVQTDVYDEASDQLNFQQRNLGFDKPEQEVVVTFEIDGQANADVQTVTADFSEAADIGLAINETETQVSVIGNGSNDVIETRINPVANEITARFETTADTDAQLVADIVYEPEDPVEGLNIPDTIQTVDIVGISPRGDSERDGFLAAEVGATAISHADIARAENTNNNAFIGEPVQGPAGSGVSLSSRDDPDGVTNPGAFLVHQDQVVTFETAQRGNTVSVYRAATTENDAGQEVYTLPDDPIRELGTTPGKVTNLDTSGLEPGKYFVEFDSNPNDAIVLDVRALNLSATVVNTTVQNRTISEVELLVNSSDVTGGDIQVFFREAGDDDIGDVIHVEEDSLNGATGNTSVIVDPQLELNGAGTYTATVLHVESEVRAVANGTALEGEQNAFQVVEPDDINVTVTSPTTADQFVRGDIVPITLEYTNTDVGTLTFGNEAENNVEINVTVLDLNEDGEATIYLNTYQTGAGEVLTDNGNIVDNVDSSDPFFNPVNRNHGFFVNPANNDSAIIPGADGADALAHSGIDILGGPQNGAVLDSQLYDITTVEGRQSYIERPSFDDRSILRLDERNGTDLDVRTAPGVGSASLSPTTGGDVLSEFGNTVFPANGTIAENDTLLLDLQSDGLGGLLYEAVLENDQNNPDINRTQFVEILSGTADNDIIKETFFSAFETSDVLDFTVRVEENASTVPGNVEETLLDLAAERQTVIAGNDSDGNLNRYFIPIRLNPEESDLVQLGDLEAGQNFVSTVSLSPDDDLGDQVNIPVNQLLARDGESDSVSFEFVPAEASADTTRDDTVAVPRAENVTVTGTTTVAAGTPLEVDLTTVPGQETPFVKLFSDVVAQSTPAGQPSEFSVTADFTSAQGQPIDSGTQFEIEVFRSDSDVPGALTPEPVDGVVQAAPAVQTLEFADQDSTGQTVVIEEFRANQGGFVAIENANGQRLGVSTEFPRGTTVENRSITLDTPIQTTQELTAVALLDRQNPYTDNGSRVTDNATVTVGEAGVPATLRVTSIDPLTASVEVGTTVDVSATIDNIGDQSGSTTVELTIAGTSIGTENVSLAGGESTTVSFSADTQALGQGEFTHTVSTDANSLSGSLTVTGPTEPASFEVSNLQPPSATVEAGAVITVSAEVANTGGESGTATVELSAGSVTTSRDVPLPAGQSQPVSFTVDTAALGPGNYTHQISAGGDSASGDLTVEAPPEPASFSLSGLSPQSANVTQGDSINVSATLANGGELEGSTTVELAIGGSTIDSQDVTLAGGASQSVEFTGVDTSSLSPGDYTHEVSETANGSSVSGSLTVTAQPDMNETDSGNETNETNESNESDGSGPGFGVLVAALAVLGAALLAARRQAE